MTQEVFEVKKKIGSIKLPGGVTLEIRVPSIFEIKKIQKELEASEASEAIDVLINFYKKLGLTDEALEHFDSKDFNDLFLYLCGSKKN